MVSELDYPDQHHLRAAEGWLELGQPLEAEEDLNRISAGNRMHPDVLEMRWKLATDARAWTSALEIARELLSVDPQRPSGWISQSYCLHELKQTQEAWDCLLPAASKFPKVGIIPYNLACYACQLGRLLQAKNWLAKAVAACGEAQIRAMALGDEDLRPLWSEIEMF